MKKFLILALMCAMAVCNGEVVRNSRGEKLVSRIEHYNIRCAYPLTVYEFKYDEQGDLVEFKRTSNGIKKEKQIWKKEKQKNILIREKEEDGLYRLTFDITLTNDGFVEEMNIFNYSKFHRKITSLRKKSFKYDENGHLIELSGRFIVDGDKEETERGYSYYKYIDGNRFLDKRYNLSCRTGQGLYSYEKTRRVYYKYINDTNIDFNALEYCFVKGDYFLTEWFGYNCRNLLKTLNDKQYEYQYIFNKDNGNIEWIYKKEYRGHNAELTHSFKIFYVEK